MAILPLGTIGSPMSLSPTETLADESSLLSFCFEEVYKDTEDWLNRFLSDRIVTRLVIASLSVAFTTSLIVCLTE